MSAIVIYNSQTGFTKRYANWISSYDITDKKYIEPILAYLKK